MRAFDGDAVIRRPESRSVTDRQRSLFAGVSSIDRINYAMASVKQLRVPHTRVELPVPSAGVNSALTYFMLSPVPTLDAHPIGGI